MPALTEARIAQLIGQKRPEKGSRFFSDESRDAPKGFMLRVLASGSATFVLSYRDAHGKKHRRSIGSWPTWPLSQARAEANRLRREIDKGEDPFAKPEPEPEPVTIRKLVEEYGEHTINPQSAQYLRLLATAHGDKMPADLTRADVIRLVEKKAKTAPISARQLLSYIKALLTYAVDREHIAYNVAAGLKPTRVHRTMTAPRRERILTDEEIRTLLRAPLSAHTAILRAILITGQRPGECREVLADEVRGGVWVMPADKRKNRQEHRLPLTPLADEAIRAVVTLNRRPSAQAVARIARTLQPDVADYWRPHDLRRTARTTLARLGISDDIGERVIGHAQGGLIKTYNRHRYEDEMLAALTTYNDWLAALIAGPSGRADVSA